MTLEDVYWVVENQKGHMAAGYGCRWTPKLYTSKGRAQRYCSPGSKVLMVKLVIDVDLDSD